MGASQGGRAAGTRRAGTFDYIIAGAGSGGCVLAARLSQDADVRVLVLEADGPERTRAMTVPSAWPENLGSAADWAGVTAPQADAGPVAYPRGRALGGSGAVNAMAHIRGHAAVYDDWAADGAAGWGFADLLPFFRRSEQAAGRDRALRGTPGPVRVGPAAEAARHRVASAFAEGLRLAGCPVTDDLSGAVQEGVVWADLAIAAGLRTWIRRTVASYYHPAATCQMGGGEAVTDTRLRVRGVTGLRVVDASVIPVIPNAPLHATVLAVVERSVGLITGASDG